MEFKSGAPEVSTVTVAVPDCGTHAAAALLLRGIAVAVIV